MTNLKLQKRNNDIQGLLIFSLVFFAAYIAYGIFVCLLGVDLDNSFPIGWFTFLPEDRFKDFFTINYSVKDWDPYASWLSNYPPLILLLARIVSGNTEYHSYELHTLQEAAADPAIMRSFYILVAAFVIISTFIIVRYAKKRIWAGLLVSLMLMMSAPVIFAIDRGNYIFVSYVLLLLWAICEGQEETEDLAAVFIGLCAAVKIYPLIIIFFFVLERKWRKTIIACITGALPTILLFFTFRGTFRAKIGGFGGGLLGFGGGNYMPYFNVGLTGLASYIMRWVTGEVQDANTVKYIWLGVGSILAIILMLLLLREKRIWLRILILTGLMIYLTPNSYIYNSAYLIAPIVIMLLGDRSKTGEMRRSDIVYLVITALLLVPKAYSYPTCVDVSGDDLSQAYVGVNVLIDGLLYTAMFVFYIISSLNSPEGILRRRGLRTSKN